MNWLRRQMCRLFHKTWKARICVNDPVACEKAGVFNEVVNRRWCPKCNNIFRWTIR
jgi:hypothetical protein